MHFHTISFRGIGTITRRELDVWFPRKVRDVVPFRVRDYDITSFSIEVPVANLMQLGTAEDLFCRIALTDLSGKRKDLEHLQEATRRPALQSSLAIHREIGVWPVANQFSFEHPG